MDKNNVIRAVKGFKQVLGPREVLVNVLGEDLKSFRHGPPCRALVPLPPVRIADTGMRPGALVIGGGPAGSAVATLMARAGGRVVLIEREAGPHDKVCGPEFMTMTG